MRADPDGTDEAAEAKKVRHDAYLVPSPFGYVGQMRFGTVDGAIVTKESQRGSKRSSSKPTGPRPKNGSAATRTPTS